MHHTNNKEVKNNFPIQNHKKTYDLNENWIKILKLFFDGPNVTLHIREVARRSNLTPRGSKYILDSLTKEGLLKNEPNDIVNNYRGNYNNEKFMGLKRSLNLYSLYSSGLISNLEEFYRIPKCIVLFGSYAKGEDTGKSDIDIAVVTNMEGFPELRENEQNLNRKINITLIKNIRGETPSFVNSLANGIVLSGYLEVV
jgi:predicted nucleotidyltransferase